MSKNKKKGEALQQDAICDYLQKRGYTFWRQNTSGIFNERGGYWRKPNKYSVVGVSDIVVLSDGKAYFIEVKDIDGVQSEDQRLFQEFVERAGCEYYLVYDVDDVIAAGF